MRVFEHSVLRILFSPERAEVRRNWGKLRNEELNVMFSSPYTIRVTQIENNEMSWVCSTYGGEVPTGFWSGNLKERPKSRWEDNTNMDFQEVGWRGMDWIDLAQDRDRCQALVHAILNFRVP